MANVVVLAGDVLYAERPAGGAITPGHLIDYSTTNVVVNATAADTSAPIMFAVENSDEGKGILDAYASGDRVRFVFPSVGALINAWVEAAAVLVVGTALQSGGSGNLEIFTTGRIIAYSEEAKTVGGSAERTRVRIA